MSVDARTRTDGAEPVAPADELMGSVLATAFAGHADLLAPATRWLAPGPIRVAVEGSGSTVWWTLRIVDGRPLVSGDGPDGPVLRVSEDALAALVADQVTPMAWFSNGSLRFEGRLGHLLDWWLLVRGALDDRPPTLPGTLDFAGPDGSPLDLGRSFSLEDPDETLAYFLGQAGYLHLRGVFTDQEMAAVSADMDAAAPDYRPADGRSWWATTGDGIERLVRMQEFDAYSATVRSLLDGDERVQRIAALTGDGHRLRPPGTNRIEALEKPIGVVRGISDVPWHKDCSLGRHSYECCEVTIGISVTGADADSGQLRVVAGSNRAHVWPALIRPGTDLPDVALATAGGDVTVHLSCTLHMAQPPTRRSRRVLYAGLSLPPRPASGEAVADARRRLREIREAAPVSVSQPPSAAVAPPGR